MRRGWRDIHDYIEGHTLAWYRGGKAFFDELAGLIDSARQEIHFQVYLIDPDETGWFIMDRLMAAAQRGVTVYLVVDDFGAGKLTEATTNKLEASGIIFKRFEPYFMTGKYYVGRRMHQKVVVIDERIAVVGGMNVADRYRGTPDQPAWLDYAVRVEGPVCVQLAKACLRVMERQFLPAAPRWPNILKRGGRLDPDKTWVRIRKNDWLRNRREITSGYNRAVRNARHTITIVGGYFLPGLHFRRLLAAASRRGVAIRIILTRFSDVPVVKYASDFLYGWLLRNKIRIYESKEAMVHGKVAIVDDLWVTVGSYNQNHLSAYLSLELNLDIVNREFAAGFHRHLLEVIDHECAEVTYDSYERRAGWYTKLRRWVSYQLVRLSLRMLFAVNRIFGVND
jgi:cardiolipin synthase